MKKVLFFLVLFAGLFTAAQAQKPEDVIYFKDGSIIRGWVLEVIPDKQLTIKTADGRIFIYEMSSVEHIAKESEIPHQLYSESRFKKHEIARGFKVFVESSYAIGIRYGEYDRIETAVSLGYQMLPYLYVGGGAAFSYSPSHDDVAIPVFANIRANIINGPITPCFSTKIGYNFIGESNGLYFDSTIGCRLAFSNKHALYAGFGNTFYAADSEGMLKLQVGFEF
ncbi:MAG: hypothetical protein D8B52_03795 [Prevotella sp.]|jgi:hypothetical protein|uniref:hypothetical protein n=1 Tax=Hoylesella saccharolytica TaxID=633701 RepID=UPI0004726709|nr:hypothetical protein [Hoylesella saccharolytica]RKW60666.1 MAG: hypothetical protein D8B52_03795 [Prevotella sp.]